MCLGLTFQIKADYIKDHEFSDKMHILVKVVNCGDDACRGHLHLVMNQLYEDEIEPASLFLSSNFPCSCWFKLNKEQEDDSPSPC